MTGDVLRVLAANGLVLSAGIGVLRLAGRTVDGAAALGLAYAAGAAAVGVLVPLGLLAGLPFSLWWIGGLAALVLAAGLARRSAVPFPPPLRPSRWALVTWAAAAAVLALLFVDALHQPLWAADAWEIWAPKAKAMVTLDGVDARFLAFNSDNSNYPLLVPSLEAIAFEASGRSTLLLDVQAWLLLAALAGSLAALLRDRVPALLLAAVGLGLVLAPSLQIQAVSGYADVPLAVFVALAGLCAWRWLELGDRSALALLAVFSAAGLVAKVEGRLFVGALLAVAVVLAWRRSRRLALWTASAGAAAALVALGPWLAWTARHDLGNYYDPGAGAGGSGEETRLERIPVAAYTLAREALDPTSWLVLGLLGIAAVVAALCLPRGRAGGLLVAGTTIVSLAGLVWVYGGSPYASVESHLDHSANRVITSLVLLVGALAPALLARADPALADADADTG